MKKDTFYFSHDYSSANDVKCLFLRQQLGMEGYGIFWYLIETLATAGGSLPLKIIPVLAMQMQVTEIKVSGVIHSFDLFRIDKDAFFSPRLNQHMDLRKTLSIKGKEGALNRWGNRDANSPPIGDGNAKESKGKEIKENKGNYIEALPLPIFSFKKSLIEFGFLENLVDDWLKVRKLKKSANTETALKSFMTEVEKSATDKNQILRICVEKSWCGFKTPWIENLNNNLKNGNVTTGAKQNVRRGEAGLHAVFADIKKDAGIEC